MSDAEDEVGTSHPTTPPRRRSQHSERRQRSKQRDPGLDLDDGERKELLRKYAATDQNLEKFAQAHNMTALNVKSVLRSVIKNHRALARVLGTDAPDELIDGVRITRSKTRALQDSSNNGVDMTSNVPIRRGNTWVDLRFNEDDEYDNDYQPDEDESGDDIGSGSSRLGSSDDDESENLSEFERDEENIDEEHNLTIVKKDVNESINEVGMSSFESLPRFHPASTPGFSLNDDEPSADYEQFKYNLNLDDIPYNEEDDEDPEYMVPTEAIFRDERDDLLGDYWSSTIPQKEMEGLIEDIVPSERFGELAKNLNPPVRQMGITRPTRGRSSSSNPTEVIESRRVEEIGPIFTQLHRAQLRSQMEQHVQLLTQAYVGCFFEPLLQEEKEKSGKMIENLYTLSFTAGHFGNKSAFHINNLSYAIDTCKGMVDRTPSNTVEALAKEELIIPHSMLSITKEVIGTSKAILYPHIVSKHRLVQSIGNSGWHREELILFALAINRYKDEPESHRMPQKGKYSIIAENCLPWRTMNELRWQYNGMKRGINRNGKTKHNRTFFDIAEGELREAFSPPLRAKLGWTMIQWQKNALPSWFNYQRMKRKSREAIEKEQDHTEPEEKKLRTERRIEEGDEEMEPIVILDSDDEETGENREESVEVELDEEVDTGEDGQEEENEGNGDELEGTELEEEEVRSDQERRENHSNNMMMYSMEDDECAMDSTDKSGLIRSPDEVEDVRGDEKGRDGQPIDFSHLMREMSPSSQSRMRTPSPRREDREPSDTPSDKTILPATPGKRMPSPSEESMPWLLEIEQYRNRFSSPPLTHSPPTSSRIKTPGGTMDYVDSLMGYFETPEKEIRKKNEDGPSTSKKSTLYSNLFGDFDFDDSIGGEEMNEMIDNKEKDEERIEKEITTIEDQPEQKIIISVPAPVKQRKKRTTREEKERIGLAAINDPSIRLRVRNALARKTADDIRSRMNMHSSVFKQIQGIIHQTIENKDKEKAFTNLLPLLSEDHKEVLYLLSAFAPSSSLPRSLAISHNRRIYMDAIDILCIIFAYLSIIQRRLSYRQLLKMILEAHSTGGNEKVFNTLKDVLVNDPLLLRALTEYFTPSIPSKKSTVWECIDLRKEEAFDILKENPKIERIDVCDVMGAVPTKKMLAKEGKPPSTLMINHEGEPLLRDKNGKYKEIAVTTEGQMEEEKKNRQLEKDEEKKARQREKIKEKREEKAKAKKVEKREERAREKKKEKERIIKEEEMKKIEKDAPPNHPWNRELDKSLLMIYNELSRVTKRAVRKLAVDLPYSANFTQTQLQARLDYLLELAE